EEAGLVVDVVAIGPRCAAPDVHVGEDADEYVPQRDAAAVDDLVVDADEIVLPRSRPRIGGLLDLDPERNVLGARGPGIFSVVEVFTGEHLLADSGKVLVAEPIPVVVFAVQEVLVDPAVTIIIGIQ